MTAKTLSLQLEFDQDLAPCDEPSERILEVTLRAPAASAELQRSPLNLALVLDRSGSMNGAKMENVKRAAAHVVDMLEDADRVALVIYDDQIDVLYPSSPLEPAHRNGDVLPRVGDPGKTGGRHVSPPGALLELLQ